METFFGPVGIGAGGTIVLKRIEESNYFTYENAVQDPPFRTRGWSSKPSGFKTSSLPSRSLVSCPFTYRSSQHTIAMGAPTAQSEMNLGPVLPRTFPGAEHVLSHLPEEGGCLGDSSLQLGIHLLHVPVALSRSGWAHPPIPLPPCPPLHNFPYDPEKTKNVDQ